MGDARGEFCDDYWDSNGLNARLDLYIELVLESADEGESSLAFVGDEI